MRAAHLRQTRINLKRAWREATFMRGQVEPAAKHLFDAISAALRDIDAGIAELRELEKSA
jgi:hypothetical protein